MGKLSGDNPTLTKQFVAAAKIHPFRIVQFGDEDGKVQQAAAATVALFGVTDSLGGEANGRIDVHVAGIVTTKAGGRVARGAPVTSDASGQVVAAGRSALRQTLVDGSAAGDITVTGIGAEDELVSVLAIDATDASEDFSDLTDEFSITAAGTINNAGGTATTGKGLLVTWRSPVVAVIGRAFVAMEVGDLAPVLIAPGHI